MKQLILSIILLIMLASACTEEVIKIQKEIDTVYVDRTPLRQVFNVRSLDSIRTITTQLDTITVIETQVDTVFLTETEFVIDTVEVITQQIDTLFIETVRVDTVERQTELTYDPLLKPYVDSFFELVDNRLTRQYMLDVNVDMRVSTGDWTLFRSVSIVENGDWVIYITLTEGWCPEAAVYRELIYTMWGRPYKNIIIPGDHAGIMTSEWWECLETMSPEDREMYISEVFDEIFWWRG